MPSNCASTSTILFGNNLIDTFFYLCYAFVKLSYKRTTILQQLFDFPTWRKRAYFRTIMHCLYFSYSKINWCYIIFVFSLVLVFYYLDEFKVQIGYCTDIWNSFCWSVYHWWGIAFATCKRSNGRQWFVK